MSDSVFQQALSRLQQMPEPDVGVRLRTALEHFDLEVSWNLISPRLKAQPGSHSHKNYFSAYKDLLAWAQVEEMSLLDPPPHFGAEYQQHLGERYQASQASINTRLSQARRFFKVFRQLGVLPVNLDPFSILVRAQVVPGQHRDYYSDAEVSRLLAQAELPDRVLLLMGAHAGLTTAEVLGLGWPDLHLTEGEIVLPARTVSMSPELYRFARALAEQEGGGVLFTRSGPIFAFTDQNALRAGIYTLCLKANVPYRAWRGLRHAAGRRFFRQSGDLTEVARVLGVENPHLVRMYAETPEEENI